MKVTSQIESFHLHLLSIKLQSIALSLLKERNVTTVNLRDLNH